MWLHESDVRLVEVLCIKSAAATSLEFSAGCSSAVWSSWSGLLVLVDRGIG